MKYNLFGSFFADAKRFCWHYSNEELDDLFGEFSRMFLDEQYCRSKMMKTSDQEFKACVKNASFAQLQEICTYGMKIITIVKNERKTMH